MPDLRQSKRRRDRIDAMPREGELLQRLAGLASHGATADARRVERQDADSSIGGSADRRQPVHYVAAAGALLAALRETCGPMFTDEAEAAWRELYNLVAAVMIRAHPEFRAAR